MLHVVTRVPPEKTSQYCESKLLEFGDGAVKYARLEYSSDAESAINSFLDQELHSCLKTLLPTSGYPHLDEYNEADAKLEKLWENHKEE